jgi:hypothetical protein
MILLVAILVGGAVIGALFSLVSSLFYLVFLFPLLMGVIGGILIAIAVRSGKVRNPLVALISGLLIGIVMYGSMWAVNYLQFRNVEKSVIVSRAPTTNPADVDTFIDQTLAVKTGSSGFPGYVLLTGQEGVSIGRVGSGRNALNLGPTFSWVYWGLELLLILWLASTLGRSPAREPFCEACERWYPRPALLGTLGSSRTKEVLGLIDGGQYQKLGEELQSNPALPNVGVFLATCGDDCPEGDAYLAARRQTRGSNGSVVLKDLQAGLISHTQLQDLRQGIENRKALYGG